jgi:hypothetical protein
MSKRTQLYQAVAAALFLAAGASNPAFAVNVVNEIEPVGTMGVNDSILTPQRLTVDREGKVEVTGAIGVTDPDATPLPDVDFYAFDAQEGDLLAIDIDFGMKPFEDPKLVRSVDTILAIFGPLPSLNWQRQNNDTDPRVPRDEGSWHIGDALIPEFRAPRTGTYVVGVSSKPRDFVHGGGTINNTVTGRAAMFPNGSYKLIISGVTAAEQAINIEIKPGSGEEAPLNPKSKGKIPVALLSHDATASSAKFDALKVDLSSLTFGRTGDENSYAHCNKEGLDVNADGLLDLVCHFENVSAGWQPESDEGTIKGKTMDGSAFKGSGRLKVAPKKIAE